MSDRRMVDAVVVREPDVILGGSLAWHNALPALPALAADADADNRPATVRLQTLN